MFRSVENTVNEGGVKVEGATPSCLSWAPRQWVVGGLYATPPFFLQRVTWCGQTLRHTTPGVQQLYPPHLPLLFLVASPYSGRSCWVQCSPMWSSCVSGQHATSPLPERVNLFPHSFVVVGEMKYHTWAVQMSPCSVRFLQFVLRVNVLALLHDPVISGWGMCRVCLLCCLQAETK
jgi:hypothetical protein